MVEAGRTHWVSITTFLALVGVIKITLCASTLRASAFRISTDLCIVIISIVNY